MSIDYLALQLKHIGDLITSLPALGLLKKHFPQKKTALLSRPSNMPLVYGHPWVDQAYTLSYTDKSLFKSNVWELSNLLRKKKVASAISFDGQPRSGVLAFLSSIKKRYAAPVLYPGLLKYGMLYNNILDLDKDLVNNSSQSFRNQLFMAAALGVEPCQAIRPIAPPLSEEHLNKARGLLALLPGEGPKIGLALTGMQLEKSWPLAHFALLSRKLWYEADARIFVTGLKEDSNRALILRRKSAVPVADFCGRTNLLELLALINESDIFITVDTGTSHLASLTNTPIISIFTWTNPLRWSPQSPYSHVFCYKWALKRFGLDAEQWNAYDEVTAEHVYKKVMDLIVNNESPLK